MVVFGLLIVLIPLLYQLVAFTSISAVWRKWRSTKTVHSSCPILTANFDVLNALYCIVLYCVVSKCVLEPFSFYTQRRFLKFGTWGSPILRHPYVSKACLLCIMVTKLLHGTDSVQVVALGCLFLSLFWVGGSKRVL